MDQAEAAKPTLAKMDSSSALDGVVSSTQPVTVCMHGRGPCRRVHMIRGWREIGVLCAVATHLAQLNAWAQAQALPVSRHCQRRVPLLDFPCQPPCPLLAQEEEAERVLAPETMCEEEERLRHEREEAGTAVSGGAACGA